MISHVRRELGMAVVNISLITDYDAGLLEGTEAVNASTVLEVFQRNAERIQKVVLDMIGRFPQDLDALEARKALEPTRGDGHAISLCSTSPSTATQGLRSRSVNGGRRSRRWPSARADTDDLEKDRTAG